MQYKSYQYDVIVFIIIRFTLIVTYESFRAREKERERDRDKD